MVDASESYGPFVVTLERAEIEAAAARYGLRAALSGGLTASHQAPLAAFVLIMLFAAILALTGFISRRAAEIAILISACAFMIQRLGTHQRVWRARNKGRLEIERRMSGPVTTTIEADGVTQANASEAWRLLFLDCIEAEESGGLIYLWERNAAPVVLPSRLFAEGQAARLLTWLRRRVQRPTIV
jgi:hypothetical protein